MLKGTSSKNRKLYQSYLVSNSKNKDNDDIKSPDMKGKNRQMDNITQTK
ncbi:7383_t:CDS:2 [Funneliformis mosseae]|uniref:7383_t:CDS:1 n=1 Tax=Funneliformis mosseae TaxID=27381 RepID=A0A9N9CZ96_FUNMO|nr:7383_t:CDS:2 [Funneliformis mosseae]